jgi:hypothetical protein
LVGLSSALLTFLPVAGLGGREQVGGALQREQVLADCRRQDDIGHIQRLPQVCVAGTFSRADGLHDLTRVRYEQKLLKCG